MLVTVKGFICWGVFLSSESLRILSSLIFHLSSKTGVCKAAMGDVALGAILNFCIFAASNREDVGLGAGNFCIFVALH